MSTISQLLRELRSEGRQDSSGRFTLDPSRAREKMKKYQLVAPHLYVLQVVQSAVAGGASFLRARCDADDCILMYDGQPFTREELENLFVSLFTSQNDRTARRLRELAIGLNSALGLRPQFITCESWDGRELVRLRLTPRGEKVETAPERPWEGAAVTRIHVKERPGLRTAGKFLAKLVDLPAEGAALRDRCAYAPIAVEVNSRPVNRQPDLGPCLAQVRLEEAGFRACLGIPEKARNRSCLDFVVQGVTVSRKHPAIGYASVVGVVWADHLVKNVSQSDLVENAAYRDVLVRVRTAVKQMVLDLARNYAEAREKAPAALDRVLREAIADRVRARDYSERWRDYKQALIDLPLFELADGATTPLRPLLEQFQETGELLVSRDRWDYLPRDGRLVVRLTPDTEETLKRVFPRFRSAERELEKAMRWHREWERFCHRLPERPAFQYGSFLARVELGNGLEGEVALPAGPPQRAPDLILYREHRRLFKTHLCPPGGGAWPGVAAAVNHDDLEPNEDYTAVKADSALAEVYGAVEAAFPRLFAELARRYPPAGPERNWAEAYLLEYLLWLGRREGLSGLPPEVSELPFLRLLAGGLCSLAEVRREVERNGCFRYLEQSLRPEAFPELEDPVLVLDPRQLAAMEALFGKKSAQNCEARYRAVRNRALFLQRPRLPLRAPREALVSREFGGPEGIRGVAWIPREGGGRGFHLEIRREQRLLVQRTLEPGLDTTRAVVEAPQVRPTEDWTDVVQDGHYEAACTAAIQAARRLTLDLAEQLDRAEGEERLSILESLWDRLSWESGPRCEGFLGEVDAVRRELQRLPLFPLVSGGMATLEELLEQGEVPYTTSEPPVKPEPGERVLLVPPPLLGKLRSILGTCRLRDMEEEFRIRERRKAYEEAAPVEELRLPPGDYLAVVELEGEVEGRLGLLPEVGASSPLTLYRRRRLLGQLQEDLEVPVVASLNCDDLNPGPDWQGVCRNQAFRRVLERVRQAGREAARELSRRDDPGLRDYLRDLAVRLLGAAQSPAPESLEEALLEAPLFPTLSGPPLSLGELTAAFRRQGRLRFLPQGGRFAPEDAELLEEPLPLLSSRDQSSLSRLVYPLEDCTREIEVARQARINRSRPRWESLSLEEHYPGVRWLARTPVEEEGLDGELGLPLQRPPQPGVRIAVDRLPMAMLDLHPGPGFLGVVNGPFAVTPTWDGLADPEEVRRRVRPSLERLMTRLLERFPDPTRPEFRRAREAALRWTDDWWKELGRLEAGSLEEAISRLRLFPLPGGRYADLAAVGEQITRTGRLLTCLPGESPPLSGELILEVAPGSGLAAFLRRLSPGALRPWQEEVAVEVPLEPPDPEPPAEEPAPQRFPEDREPRARVLAALKAELRLLRSSSSLPLPDRLLEEMHWGPVPAGTFCAWDRGGRRLRLNPDHPVLRRLLESNPIRPEQLYIVLSAIYSVLNRALPSIRDTHERQFHRQVAATLLGGKGS